MDTFAVKSLPNTSVNRTVESFEIDAIANVELILPPHRLLPLDDPLHLDRELHTSLHRFYAPEIHNAAYLALASPEEWEEWESEPIPPEEPALIVLVSRMVQIKNGERLEWQSPSGVKRSVPVFYGLGAAVKTAGPEIIPADPFGFRSFHPARPIFYGLEAALKTAGPEIIPADPFGVRSYHPVRAGNSISVDRFDGRESSLNAFVEFRMAIDKEGKEMTSCIAFSSKDYPTKEGQEMLKPTVSATGYGAILSPSSVAHREFGGKGSGKEPDRALGRITTCGYQSHGQHAIDCTLVLEEQHTSRLDSTSNSVPVRIRNLPPAQKAAVLRDGVDELDFVRIPLQERQADVFDHTTSTIFKAGIATGATDGHLGLIQKITWLTHTSYEYVIEGFQGVMRAAANVDSGGPVYDASGAWLGMVIAEVMGRGVFTPVGVIKDFFRERYLQLQMETERPAFVERAFDISLRVEL
ncbi:hypothetical protein HK104_005724 [Borealophlyctis nickersoniae]|nr:hypothetical protein HK104_005724 [Borealophlyctis nickersoniae]